MSEIVQGVSVAASESETDTDQTATDSIVVEKSAVNKNFTARKPNIKYLPAPWATPQMKEDLVAMRAHGAIFIRTMDTEHTLTALISLSKTESFTWVATLGFLSNRTGEVVPGTVAVVEALNHVRSSESSNEYYFCNADDYFKDNEPAKTNYNVLAVLQWTIEQLNNKNLKTRPRLFLLGESFELSQKYTRQAVFLDWPLPTKEAHHTGIINYMRHNGIPEDILTKADMDKYLGHLNGLTRSQALVFSKLIYSLHNKDISGVPKLMEKAQFLSRQYLGVSEDIAASKVSLEDIGGLDELKKWLNIRRKLFFSDNGEMSSLPKPKGILLAGVPGAGKSLTAKAIARSWDVELVPLQMGEIYGKYVGETEGNIHRALKRAEAAAPCILWIDEIEKAFPAVEVGGGYGSILQSRILGLMLTWLSEKSSGVFVVGTSNNLDALPPELLRKGRFDEIFFVDLPNEAERMEILLIHVRSLCPEEVAAQLDRTSLMALMATTEGFTGSELEQGIIDASINAASEDRKLTLDDVRESFQNTVPLSVVQKDKVADIQNWARRNKARRASAGGEIPEVPVPAHLNSAAGYL